MGFVGNHYMNVLGNSLSLVTFPYSCERNEVIHPLFYFQPKLCRAGIRLPVTEIFAQATATSTHIFMILSAVLGPKKSFSLEGETAVFSYHFP